MTSFITPSEEEAELESINFHDSLRFFQEQLNLDGKRFPSSPNIHISRNGITSKYSTELFNPMIKDENDNCEHLDDRTKSLNNCRISIPTVETILESVKVLRAIQKSQEQRWPMRKILSNVGHQTQNSVPLEKTSEATEEDVLIVQETEKTDSSANEKSVSKLNVPENDCFIPDGDTMVLLNTEFDLSTVGIIPKQEGGEMSCIDKKHYEKCGLNQRLDIDHNCHLNRKCNDDQNCGSDLKCDAEQNCDSEDCESRALMDTDCLNKLYYTIEFSNNNELSQFWPSNSITNNAAASEVIALEGCCKNVDEDIRNVQTHNNNISTSDLSLKNNTEGKSLNYSIHRDDLDSCKINQAPSKILSSNLSEKDRTSCDLTKAPKQRENYGCDNTSGMDTRIGSSINFVPNQYDVNASHSQNFYTSDLFESLASTEIDISTSSKPCARTESSDEATGEKGSSKLLSKTDLIDKKVQSYNIIRNGSAHQKLEEIPISSSSPENSLKLQDSEKILSSNGHITSSTETTQKNIDETFQEEIKEIPDSQNDRDIYEPKSNRTDRIKSERESICDKHANGSENFSSIIEQVKTDGNNRQLSLEENFNQYEVLTEACKYVPNIQAIKLSNNTSNNSISASRSNDNEVDKNTHTLSKSPVNEEEKYIDKNGYQRQTNSLRNADLSSEAHIDLNNKRLLQISDANDPLELKKKLTTSSWDLVSIVNLLYVVPDHKPPKTQSDELMFQTKVFLLSMGSFSQFSEGVYEISAENNSLTVLQDAEIILSFSLLHAEITMESGDILKIDNKMGRTLYMKHNSRAESLQMMEALQTISTNCKQPECIVHYPLKCYQNIIIIDLGSCSTRAGILMDQPTLPTLFFPSVCATDKTTGKSEYGIEALQPSKRQNSTISFPVRPSVQIIKHNIDVEKVAGIFKKIFHQLRVDPENYTVQVCLPRSLSINAQNALVKVLLEDLEVKAVSLAHQAILTMYAYNVSTGVVVDVGDRMDIVPVIDGFIVESGVTRLPYGGQRLIHHMKHALAQKHISLSNEIDSFVVQYITENLSYIALDYDAEQDLATSHPEMIRKSVTLQCFAKDESCLQCASLEEARFKVPEGLFNPDLWGLDFPGIHKLVQKAIQAAGVDTRKKIAENIYVSGGVTLIPGFVDRLRKEVTKLNEPRITPKVFASDYRYHCTYIGASRFARMDVFPQVCVNKEEYRKNQHASLKKFALCI